MLHTSAGDFPPNEYRLRLSGHEWTILHVDPVRSREDENRFRGELKGRLPYGVALWPALIALAHDVVSRAGDFRGKTDFELAAPVNAMSAMLLALAGLFAWSFLAATILPLGSEAPLVVYVRSYGQFTVPVLVATAGNYLGACTTYWLGRRAAQALGREREEAGGDTRSARLLRRLGPPALLLSWVPILGDALVALAGAVRVPFGAFSFWTAAGKAIRYAAVAWAASAA